MQLTSLGNVEVVQSKISWQTCLLSFVSSRTSAFDARILHRKGATCARGGVFKFRLVVNNDTIMHAVHTCTVAWDHLKLRADKAAEGEEAASSNSLKRNIIRDYSLRNKGICYCPKHDLT